MIAKDEMAKQEIVAKAQELFKRYGLKKTTMDDIATECRKAKSTLYHYFKSKDEVFSEVVWQEQIVLRKQIEQQVDKQKKSVDKLKTYFITVLKEIEGAANVYQIVKKDIANTPLATRLLYDILKREKKYIKNLHHQGIKSAEFLPLPEVDLDNFADLIIASLVGIINYYVMEEKDFDFNIFENAFDIILHGKFLNRAI